MIGRLAGQLVECAPGSVLLDVGGVGYALQIPLGTFYAISTAPRDRPVALHVHTHVRDDAIQLFGFASRDERRVFEQLIAVTGVGPRMALAILSGIGAAELRAAVEGQDRERLQRIPGVGRKTAERLLLELRDRLQELPAPEAPAATASTGGGGRGPRDDAISALVNLGYAKDASERAVQRSLEALGPSAELRGLLRAALRALIERG